MPRRPLAQFTVDYLRILDEDGNVDSELEPALDREQLVRLYSSMFLAREADSRMLKLQRQGRLGTFPPCTGQEAPACGAALAMGERDWLVGSYRELGARLMRGEPLENWLYYYNGYEEGNAAPASLRILPVTVVLGSQLPHAVGIAYAMKRLGEKDSAVVAFFGDGASSQGDFHEALNFAAVWKAPVVFVCQNNGWAISVPRAAQTASETIAQKAIGYGMPGVQIDGNDALAVYRTVSEALARAKAGEGPSLIEAVTYRLLMHTTADDPKKYRSADEEAAWWKRDPIPRMRAYLERRGIWDEAQQQTLEEEVRTKVEAAVSAMERISPERPDAPMDHLFASVPARIERQREGVRAAHRAASTAAATSTRAAGTHR